MNEPVTGRGWSRQWSAGLQILWNATRPQTGRLRTGRLRTGWLRVRNLANWMNLSTPLGLVAAGLAGCEVARGTDGLVFACRYRPRLPAADAFTVGNVVFFRRDVRYAQSHPVLVAHEARHSSQYATCLGLPFLPLYLLAAGWSLVRTGDPASRNLFERRAGLSDGGYTEKPSRPLLIRR